MNSLKILFTLLFSIIIILGNELKAQYYDDSLNCGTLHLENNAPTSNTFIG